MANVLTGEQVIEREEIKSLLLIAKNWGKSWDQHSSIVRAFEEDGCSCSPDRELLKELEAKSEKELESAMGTAEVDYNNLRESNQAIRGEVALRHREKEGIAGANVDAIKLEQSRSPTATAIREVTERIRKVDRVEHPGLDRKAREAVPFYHPWLVSQIKEHGGQALVEDAPQRFAAAWLGGWRP